MSASERKFAVRIVLPPGFGADRLGWGDWLPLSFGCGVVLLVPGLLLAALVQGQVAYLPWVLLGLLPMAVPLAAPLITTRRDSRRLTEREGGAELSQARPEGVRARAAWLAEDGLDLGTKTRLGWEDFRGYRVDARPEGARVVLVSRPRSPGRRRRRGLWAFPLIAIVWLEGIATEVRTAMLIFRQFGLRADASLAICIAGLYLLPPLMLGVAGLRRRRSALAAAIRNPTWEIEAEETALPGIEALLGRHLPRLDGDGTALGEA